MSNIADHGENERLRRDLAVAQAKLAGDDDLIEYDVCICPSDTVIVLITVGNLARALRIRNRHPDAFIRERVRLDAAPSPLPSNNGRHD
jgi:hypothetical protein